MRPLAQAGLLGFALLGAGGYMVLSDAEKPAVTGSIKVQATAPTLSVDPRPAMNVVKVEWRRQGFGLTAVADVSVRNNNGYAVRVDRINCRFRARDGATEEHAQGVYNIVQPRTEKLIRDVSLGFVDSDAKALDCSVVGASKEF